MEESRSRGPYWFTLQVIRTAISLVTAAIMASPVRTGAVLIIGFFLYIAGGILTSTALRSIVVSREIMDIIGWNPTFSYWWKSLFVWMIWIRILYPFLFGLAFARLLRGKEVAMCLALAASVAAFRLWLIFTGHLQLKTGSHDFALLPLCALVGAGVLARGKATTAPLTARSSCG